MISMDTTKTDFDFSLEDICLDSDENESSVPESCNSVGDVEKWAEDQVSFIVRNQEKSGWAIFDIETGPLPWEQIEKFYEKPNPVTEFNEKTVKYGNTKNPEKREEILAAAKLRHKVDCDGYLESLESSKRDFIDKAALSPITGRVVAIGIGLPGLKKIILSGEADTQRNQERNLLENIWGFINKWISEKTFIVGHNSNSFDLPFLVKRSWNLGVPTPPDLFCGRYFNPLFKDTMQIWNCGERSYVGLDALARFFGVGKKPDDCTGADFARMWDAGGEERATAIRYLENDIQMQVDVSRCMRVI